MENDKKIVFVIVEGSSEKTALASSFRQLFGERFNVVFKVIGNDITVRRDKNGPYSTPDTIKEILEGVVMEFAGGEEHFKNGGWSADDFHRVIHIIDTDGVFSDDDCVTEVESLPDGKKIWYDTSGMQALSKRNACFRNRKKRATVRALLDIDMLLESIPYNAYFMSCNLDHILSDEINLPNSDAKMDCAAAFKRKYRYDLEGFVSFFSKSWFSVMTTYRKSWLFIQRSKHSLERHTNIGLCFPNNNNEIC